MTALFTAAGWLPLLALVDVALFLIIGLGIKKMSRTASLSGLILYLVEQAAAFSSGRGSWNLVMLVIITAIFISSVRATWSHHGSLAGSSH